MPWDNESSEDKKENTNLIGNQTQHTIPIETEITNNIHTHNKQ